MAYSINIIHLCGSNSHVVKAEQIFEDENELGFYGQAKWQDSSIADSNNASYQGSSGISNLCDRYECKYPIEPIDKKYTLMPKAVFSKFIKYLP